MVFDAGKKDMLWANFFTGFADGLLIPFIVGLLVFAFTGKGDISILVFFIALVIGAIAFGLARYIGEIQEIGHHLPTDADKEAKEMATMEYIGVGIDVRTKMKQEIAEEKEAWLKEVRENELGWEKMSRKRAVMGGLQTAIGLLLGGLFSAAVFFFNARSSVTVSTSFLLFGCLPVLILVGLTGGVRALFTGRAFLKGAVFSLVYGFLSIFMPLIIVWLLTSGR